MQHLVDKRGCSNQYEIDSAGIGDWHVGQLPDKRMREHGKRRGYDVNHHARQFDARKDFAYFDQIVVRILIMVVQKTSSCLWTY